MVDISIKIVNSIGEILAENILSNQSILVYQSEYQGGDEICLECSKENQYLMIQLEDSMIPSFVYYTKGVFIFTVPFGEKKVSYSPKSFQGNIHLISARLATKEEIANYKNLALNPYDSHTNEICFPHAKANVETRGESAFEARNAINGNVENRSHGIYPYESWGINRQDDAYINIDFGRTIKTNKVVLVTRADFPHDNYWKQVKLAFSDGSELNVSLEKSYNSHIIEFDEKKIKWIKMSDLIKDETDPSPFPALTQIEVYGVEG